MLLEDFDHQRSCPSPDPCGDPVICPNPVRCMMDRAEAYFDPNPTGLLLVDTRTYEVRTL